jgi:hypothetical protein
MDGTNTLTVMATTLIKKGKPIKFNYVKVKIKAGFKGLSHQILLGSFFGLNGWV